MKQIPNFTKFKKQKKGSYSNKVANLIRFETLKNSKIKLKTTSFGQLTGKQLLTIKQTITKQIKKTGRVIINVFPTIPVTKKPNEIRMGKGKGSVYHWICKIKAGITLCEIQTIKKKKAICALKSVQNKISIPTHISF